MTDTEDEDEAFIEWYYRALDDPGEDITPQHMVDLYRIGKKRGLKEKADMKQAGKLTFQEHKRLNKQIATADDYIEAIIQQYQFGIEGAVAKVNEKYSPESTN